MSLIKDRGKKEKDVHRENTNFQSPTNMCWLLEAVYSQVSLLMKGNKNVLHMAGKRLWNTTAWRRA